jgi:hypothetical protein
VLAFAPDLGRLILAFHASLNKSIFSWTRPAPESAEVSMVQPVLHGRREDTSGPGPVKFTAGASLECSNAHDSVPRKRRSVAPSWAGDPLYPHAKRTLKRTLTARLGEVGVRVACLKHATATEQQATKCGTCNTLYPRKFTNMLVTFGGCVTPTCCQLLRGAPFVWIQNPNKPTL